ncbi:TIGR03557 family F420-dependent LLM class oxidoreductase [Phototrophicus methaneseepsis]|uniref:TIGR03557 family F420-dependent LLM class oxidoreductase n=1 Tax=Phototrophicus methaneseepsis TaxID=2710758 RepID=A0A7S8ED15_9CHLR|nr:TIGR03557 family F420-dependent LLM class oxidoreductase [Phototrophicus methaneseepsis]QPC84488.1 TIGR03557 family F420-dependent LLM class oxidoreductase [Phototrophicus methaneseepsis]
MNGSGLKIGYAISSEEHRPSDIVKHAQRAEEVGFTYALISDHFHPWIDEQGQSPFVWSVLGGIAQATQKLEIGTGVTCPLIRTHPAIIAQATATVAAMMPGRFFLGVGTGENLNEHILGDRWPAYEVRSEMLEEAIEVIRLLWQGGMQSHYGKYYTVENARIYTLPEEPIPLMVAASGTDSAELAARVGDGIISTSPDADIIKAFEEQATETRPKYGKLTVCWASNMVDAQMTAYKYWPTAGLKGSLSQQLPLPVDFESAAQNVTQEDIAKAIICGNDPQPYLDAIQEYVDAGFDHVYIHQVGPDQDGFFDFFKEHLLPRVASSEHL